MSALSATAWFLVSWLSAFAGCVFLALSQDKHWRAVCGLKQRDRRPIARTLGWAFIFASLAGWLARDGASFSGLTWPITLASTAFTVAMVLTYRDQWLRPIASLLSRSVPTVSENKATDVARKKANTGE